MSQYPFALAKPEQFDIGFLADETPDQVESSHRTIKGGRDDFDFYEGWDKRSMSFRSTHSRSDI